jgi:hypothetical protein
VISPLTTRKKRRKPDAVKYATSRSRGARSPARAGARRQTATNAAMGQFVGVRYR